MTSEDGRSAASDSSGGPTADPVGDLLLGLAAQIDHLAALFGGVNGAAPGNTAVTVDFAALFAEAGDLVARLLAALIAILEALAAALRAAPATAAGTQHYEPISVRIDVAGSSRG